MRRSIVTILGDVLVLGMLVAIAGVALPWLPAGAARMARLSMERFPILVGLTVAALAVTGTYRVPHRGDLRAGTMLGGALVALAPVLDWTPVGSVSPGRLAAGPRVALVMLALLLTWVALMAGRRLSSAAADRLWPGRRWLATTLIVGRREDYRRLMEQLHAGRWREHRVVGWVSAGARCQPGALGGISSLAGILDELEVDAVVVGGSIREERMRRLTDACRDAGCELLFPAAGPRVAGRGSLVSRLVWHSEHPYFAVGAPVLRPGAMVVKRVMDIVVAGVLLVLLGPLLLLLAIIVRLDSPGPVLFVQHRTGFGGGRFRMLKFRTMTRGAEAMREAMAHLNQTGDPRLFKIPDDPRVTRSGRWLRLWSLDELPQLWNVMTGDMSLVGPRPFPERDLVDYEDHHYLRLGAKPGITGLWQVSGRSSIVDFEEVVRLDREYIERWSIWLDLRILWRTIPVVLGRTGAC